MYKVFLEKCEDYKNVKTAIAKGFDMLGGIDKYFKKGDTVLIKPNMMRAAKEETAIATNPAIIKALAELLINSGYKPILSDSPSKSHLENIITKLNLTNFLKKKNIKIYNNSNYYKIKFEQKKILKKFKIIKTYKITNKILCTTKLKTHYQITYTNTLKNIFNYITNTIKPKLHYIFPNKNDFSKIIINLNYLLQPTFSIINNIVTIKNNEPKNNNPIKLNSLIINKNLLTSNIITYTITNFN